MKITKKFLVKFCITLLITNFSVHGQFNSNRESKNLILSKLHYKTDLLGYDFTLFHIVKQDIKNKSYNFFPNLDEYSDLIDSMVNKTIEETDRNIRSNYIYMSVGLMDILGIGFGFQINSNFAIGLKWTGYWLSGGTFVPNSGTGIGIKISQRTNWKILSNINYEYTFFYNASNQSSKSNTFIKGGALDINIGNEIINCKGIKFQWSIGIITSSAQGSPLLILPNLKGGMNINI